MSDIINFIYLLPYYSNHMDLEKLLDGLNVCKINVPYTETQYKTGHGESIWVAVASESNFKRYNDDKHGIAFNVVALNDVIAYPDITVGTKIPCELRGKFSPVIPWSYLSKKPFNEKKLNEYLILMNDKANDKCKCGKTDGDIYLSHQHPLLD